MKRRPYQPRRPHRALADLNQAFADLKVRDAAQQQQRSDSDPVTAATGATAGQPPPSASSDDPVSAT